MQQQYITVNNLIEALNYFDRLCLHGNQSRFPSKIGLQRTKYFLNLLNNPQEKLKVIHVAGTAGKGSTAYMISKLLDSLDLQVGLHFSPTSLDVRECFQINNQLISSMELCRFINQIIPTVEQMKKSIYGIPTYFELLTLLAFYIFNQKKVDYAIIETGLGGLHDATNCINNSRKIVIITKIGKDHTAILGDKLGQIAFQNAGIIQKHNHVISAWQKKSIRSVLEKRAIDQNTSIIYLRPQINFKNVKVDLNGATFDYIVSPWSFKQLRIGLCGKHQAENASLAIATVAFLSQRDNLNFKPTTIYQTLKSAVFKGHFETIKIRKKIIILDGAHNPIKMRALVSTLKTIFPKRQFAFLLVFKKGKDIPSMLRYILPSASAIFLTSFGAKDQNSHHRIELSKSVRKIFNQLGFYRYRIIQNPKQALSLALRQTKGILVITGSLYFVEEICRKNYFKMGELKSFKL